MSSDLVMATLSAASEAEDEACQTLEAASRNDGEEVKSVPWATTATPARPSVARRALRHELAQGGSRSAANGRLAGRPSPRDSPRAMLISRLPRPSRPC